LDYVDYTLVRLADESLRASLFDQIGLEQIASAAYEADAMVLGPPYSAVFDSVFIGLSVPRRAVAEAAWGPSTGADRREGRATLFGFGADTVRVEELWRGAVVANAVSPMARIQRVVSSWPDPSGIDDDIARALNGLPSDPKMLEAERRKRVLARLRAAFVQPDALSDATFDAWLAETGARSVGDWIARWATQPTGVTRVEFSPPAAAATAAPRNLPISAAVLVRDRSVKVAELLADSKLVIDQLKEMGLERAPGSDTIGRNPILVVWMLPDSTFDDADWPGGENATTDDARRLARRRTAGRWLAREGIGLVTTPSHG